MEPKKLNYSEILLIRQALEHLQQYGRSEFSPEDIKEAERLQWLFKDAVKIEVYE